MEDEDIVPNTIQLIQLLWRESHACALYWHIVYWQDPDQFMNLAQFPRLPFCGLIYIQLLHQSVDPIEQ